MISKTSVKMRVDFLTEMISHGSFFYFCLRQSTQRAHFFFVFFSFSIIWSPDTFIQCTTSIYSYMLLLQRRKQNTYGQIECTSNSFFLLLFFLLICFLSCKSSLEWTDKQNNDNDNHRPKHMTWFQCEISSYCLNVFLLFNTFLF